VEEEKPESKANSPNGSSQAGICSYVYGKFSSTRWIVDCNVILILNDLKHTHLLKVH